MQVQDLAFQRASLWRLSGCADVALQLVEFWIQAAKESSARGPNYWSLILVKALALSATSTVSSRCAGSVALISHMLGAA